MKAVGNFVAYNTGSLFYMTDIVCHFPPLFRALETRTSEYREWGRRRGSIQCNAAIYFQELRNIGTKNI
jgi:hypothetical protein